MIVLPGYRILERTGAGSSAAVYRAVHEDLRREVALKILSPGMFDAEETLNRFVLEAKLQAKLAHPNVVTVYDAGLADGRPWLATEWVDGGSLRERLDRDGALPLPEALRLAREVALGLDHAHGAGIVHRDLKPANILLAGDGRAKVSDFGLAKGVDSRLTAHTTAGIILGTPGYLAPEVLEGQAATPASDLYALGVLLHELCAGALPFHGESPAALLLAQAAGEPAGLESARPGIPPALGQLVRECLRSNPSHRPGSARDVAARLAAIPVTDVPRPKRRGGAAPTRILARPPESSRPGRAARWAFVAAAAVCAAAAWLRPQTELPRARAALEPSPAPAESTASSAPSSLTTPRIAVGCESARLWLDFPADAELRLQLAAEKAPPVPERRFPAGARELVVAGLRGDRRYRGTLSDGRTAVAVDFRTLMRLRYDEVVLLDDRECKGVALAVEDSAVAAVWKRFDTSETRSVVFRESHDGGLTWSGEKVLARPPPKSSVPDLAATGDGLVCAWTEGEAPQSRLAIVSRPRGGREWGPIARLPGGMVDTRVLATEPAGADHFYWALRPSSGEDLVRLHRPDGGVGVRVSPLIAAGHGRRDWVVAKSGDGRVVAVGLLQAGKRATLHHAVSGPSGWSTPVALEDRDGDADGGLDAVAGPRGLLLAYETSRKIRSRMSFDRGGTFTESTDHFSQEGFLEKKPPAVAASPSEYFLTYMHTSLLELGCPNLVVSRSADGLTWSRCEPYVLPPLLGSTITRAVWSGGRLIAVVTDNRFGTLAVSVPPARLARAKPTKAR